MITLEDAYKLKRGDIVEVYWNSLDYGFRKDRTPTSSLLPDGSKKVNSYMVEVFGLVMDNNANKHLFICGKDLGLDMVPSFVSEFYRDPILRELKLGNQFWYYSVDHNANGTFVRHSDLDNIIRIVNQQDKTEIKPIENKVIESKMTEKERMAKFFFSDLNKEYTPPKNSPFRFI